MVLETATLATAPAELSLQLHNAIVDPLVRDRLWLRQLAEGGDRLRRLLAQSALLAELGRVV